MTADEPAGRGCARCDPTAPECVDLSLTEMLLGLDGEIYDAHAVSHTREILEAAAISLAASGANEDPGRTVGAFSRVVFGDLRIERSQGQMGDDFSLTATLKERRASCLGITLIYLALADRLGVPMGGVLYDQHIAIRHFPPSGPVDLEPAWRGRAISRIEVAKLYPTAALRGYGACLEPMQIRAILLANRAAFVHARRRHYDRALADLDLAIDLFPEYATAWVNRAVILVALDQAADAQATLAHAEERAPGPRTREHIDTIRRTYMTDA